MREHSKHYSMLEIDEYQETYHYIEYVLLIELAKHETCNNTITNTDGNQICLSGDLYSV